MTQESTEQLASAHRSREQLRSLLADAGRKSARAAALHKATLASLRAEVRGLAAAASDAVGAVGGAAREACRRLAEEEARARRSEAELVTAVLAQMRSQGISDRQARLLLGNLADGV